MEKNLKTISLASAITMLLLVACGRNSDKAEAKDARETEQAESGVTEGADDGTSNKNYKSGIVVASSPQVSLNLCENIVGENEGIAGMRAFGQLVRTQDDKGFEQLNDVIEEADIDAITAAIVSKHENLPSKHFDTCKMFFPAVEIHFGKNGENIVLHYKGVTECCKVYELNQIKQFTITSLPAMNYSVYTEFNFTSETIDQATVSIHSYSTSVLLRESVGGSTRTFFVNDSQGDSRMLILPLQIAKAVMVSNTSHVLTPVNIVTKPKYAIGNKVRHSLLIAPDLNVPLVKGKKLELALKNKHLAGAYEGINADRSHLCPPSCNVANFETTDGIGDNCLRLEKKSKPQ